jgi:hypothetical protein
VPLVVDGENPRPWYSDLGIGLDITVSIAKTSMEGTVVVGKQSPDLLETIDLEFIRSFFYHLLFESGDEGGRSEEEGAVGERCGTSTQSTEELLRVASLSNGSCRKIEDFVAVSSHRIEQFNHSFLCPVHSDEGQNLSDDVRSGDGAVNVGYHNLIVIVPQVHCAHCLGRPLERCTMIMGWSKNVHVLLHSSAYYTQGTLCSFVAG